ncbi:HAD family hydrolase [Amphritea balenae]|uniref:HAD family hydrolase n=1 Tax=Amphritea balenae TaxID=452629 RepID=A0A3P1SKE0_9GAMM|nr:HAD family hydrolase [Amphritea balenae]RRC97404.1 HAD family hydrolase [Amphritea balenae]GGK84102.1 haloacid dehalogenase [Amphritea balenae]
MSLAIFDLDNTLLNGDSDHAWGEFLCEKGIVDVEAYRQANDYFYQQYKAGTLDIFEFLEFALKPLAENDAATLQALHDQFMQEKVAPMMLDKAATLLQKHRDQGDFLLIITATNRFVTGPIAAKLGVDDTLATDPEQIEGQYTGKIAGTPCFQAGKVERLNSWLNDNDHSLEGSYFYSDSINDKPLLDLVSNPVAVDPDELLKQAAEANSWPIISLR